MPFVKPSRHFTRGRTGVLDKQTDRSIIRTDVACQSGACESCQHNTMLARLDSGAPVYAIPDSSTLLRHLELFEEFLHDVIVPRVVFDDLQDRNASLATRVSALAKNHHQRFLVFPSQAFVHTRVEEEGLTSVALQAKATTAVASWYAQHLPPTAPRVVMVSGAAVAADDDAAEDEVVTMDVVSFIRTYYPQHATPAVLLRLTEQAAVGAVSDAHAAARYKAPAAKTASATGHSVTIAATAAAGAAGSLCDLLATRIVASAKTGFVDVTLDDVAAILAGGPDAAAVVAGPTTAADVAATAADKAAAIAQYVYVGKVRMDYSWRATVEVPSGVGAAATLKACRATMSKQRVEASVRKLGLREELGLPKRAAGAASAAGGDAATHQVVKGALDVSAEGIMVCGREHLNRAMDGDWVVVELMPTHLWVVGGSRGKARAKPGCEGMSFEDARAAGLVPSGRVVCIASPSGQREYVGAITQKQSKASEKGYVVAVASESVRPSVFLRGREVDQLVGSKVVVAIDEWDVDSFLPSGRVVEVLGKAGELATEKKAIDYVYKVPPHEFSDEALACLPRTWQVEPEALVANGGQRVDLRDAEGISVVSVDPPGCTDIDDALHCRRLPDGRYEVGVHIADVTHFVPEGSALDIEAANRGVTFYLCDRRIHMLPDLLSSDICSLRGGCDRYTFSCVAILTPPPHCHVESVKFHRSVVRSKAAFQYKQAQALIDGLLACCAPGGGARSVRERLAFYVGGVAEVARCAERYEEGRYPEGFTPDDLASAVDAMVALLDGTTRRTPLRKAAGGVGEWAPLGGAVSATEAEELESKFGDVLRIPAIGGAQYASLVSDVISGIRGLFDISRVFRQTRMDNGALDLASPTIHLDISREPGKEAEATTLSIYESVLTQSMIEEFMLFANVKVAEEIAKHLPLLAQLRRHPRPKAESFDELNAALARRQALGVSLNPDTLATALSTAVDSGDRFFNTLLRMLTTRCLTRAKYFALGKDVGSQQAEHFGLALPLYTHFTSPIRRYADDIVHRQLAYVIGLMGATPQSTDGEEISRLSAHVNNQYTAAKRAGQASVEILTAQLLRTKRHCVTTAYVVSRKGGRSAAEDPTAYSAPAADAPAAAPGVDQALKEALGEDDDRVTVRVLLPEFGFEETLTLAGEVARGGRGGKPVARTGVVPDASAFVYDQLKELQIFDKLRVRVELRTPDPAERVLVTVTPLYILRTAAQFGQPDLPLRPDLEGGLPDSSTALPTKAADDDAVACTGGKKSVGGKRARSSDARGSSDSAPRGTGKCEVVEIAYADGGDVFSPGE